MAAGTICATATIPISRMVTAISISIMVKPAARRRTWNAILELFIRTPIGIRYWGRRNRCLLLLAASGTRGCGPPV